MQRQQKDGLKSAMSGPIDPQPARPVEPFYILGSRKGVPGPERHDPHGRKRAVWYVPVAYEIPTFTTWITFLSICGY
jgi:hypothetical protein